MRQQRIGLKRVDLIVLLLPLHVENDDGQRHKTATLSVQLGAQQSMAERESFFFLIISLLWSVVATCCLEK